MPINYYSNRKAWMTSELWKEIMTKLNKKMTKENRSILMFIDNCSAHPESLKLSNIKFVFLPPNTTSRSQPLDAGIIKAFKGYYRKLMVKQLLAIINSGVEIDSKSISLLDAVFMIYSAWNEVKVSTIQNCFSKCGFIINDIEDECDFDENFDEVWETAQRLLDIDIVFEEFVECDEDLAVNENLTEEKIIEEIISERNANTSEELIESDEEDNDIEISDTLESKQRSPTLMDAIKAVSTLRQYFINCKTIDSDIMYDLDQINQKAFDYNFKILKQTKITD